MFLDINTLKNLDRRPNREKKIVYAIIAVENRSTLEEKSLRARMVAKESHSSKILDEGERLAVVSTANKAALASPALTLKSGNLLATAMLNHIKKS